MRTLATTSEVAAVPPGTCLVHIGPPKTGTTAIQAAAHHHRDRLAEQGVLYASHRRHDRRAVTNAVLGRPVRDDRGADRSAWTALAARVVRSDQPRTLLSSETLSRATAPAVERIVEDLGGDVHVVATARALAPLLASHWQQQVQDWNTATFQEYLVDLFADHPVRPLKVGEFWDRFDLSRLLFRWASVVGWERITLVVLDPGDRSFLPRAFEHLLGLAPETLRPPEYRTNPSLAYPQVELIRQFATGYRALGVRRREWIRVLRPARRTWSRDSRLQGDRQRVRTPQWAAEQAVHRTGRMLAELAETDVRVIGDLGDLRSDPSDFPVEDVPPTTVPVGDAARLAAHVLRAVCVETDPRQVP